MNKGTSNVVVTTTNKPTPHKEVVVVTNNYKGLAFEGGGVLGAAHIGALEGLILKGIHVDNFTHFIGSSVGSLLAVALACNGTVDYLKKELMSVNLNSFKDDSKWYIPDLVRLESTYGWYKGQSLEAWFGSIIEKLTGNTDTTFLQAYNKFHKYVAVTMTEVGREICKTVYADHITFPNLPLKAALRRSASIPIFFECVRGCKAYGDCSDDVVYADGGTLDNYPIEYLYKYLPKEQVIGIKLMSTSELKPQSAGLPPDNLLQYAESIVNALRSQALQLHVKPADLCRTIFVDVGDISSTDFGITDDQKLLLISKGSDAGKAFIK